MKAKEYYLNTELTNYYFQRLVEGYNPENSTDYGHKMISSTVILMSQYFTPSEIQNLINKAQDNYTLH